MESVVCVVAYPPVFVSSDKNKISMKIKKGFALREVCGEQVVMGEGLEVVDFRNLVGLNATASFLWKEAEQLGEFISNQLVAGIIER